MGRDVLEKAYGEIRKIERLLDLQLTRRQLPHGLEQEAPRIAEVPAIQPRAHAAHGRPVRSLRVSFLLRPPFPP